jgi:molybdopterin-guanine dinucleotide biosynthesis protein
MTANTEPGECLGRKLLIVGDVNTGKTTLTRKMLEDFCGRGLGRRIAVLDLAPHISEQLAAQRGLRGVGGHLDAPAACGALMIREQLEPPRLSSASEAEAMRKAARNKELADAAWQRAGAGGRDILVVNDVSMYLQAGDADELIARFASADTVIANGYFGERLGGGELTRRERAQMERLRAWFERTGSVLVLTKTY